MEAYDLIPEKELPSEVKLLEKKRFRSGPIGIKSAAEGEYIYPESGIKKSQKTTEFQNANLLTVEIEEESSTKISQKRVQIARDTSKNNHQTIEDIKILDTSIMKISTKFGENDIDYDLIWNDDQFFIVVYGQPFNIVESLAKLTIQNLMAIHQNSNPRP